jgi:hypothetical protein
MNGYATLIVALIVAIAIALVAEAHTKPSVDFLLLAGPAHAEAPDIDQQRAHGQFGVRACALVSQAALDAKMTRRWYRAAAHMLRGCGRITTARIAERKARRRGRMDQ